MARNVNMKLFFINSQPNCYVFYFRIGFIAITVPLICFGVCCIMVIYFRFCVKKDSRGSLHSLFGMFLYSVHVRTIIFTYLYRLNIFAINFLSYSNGKGISMWQLYNVLLKIKCWFHIQKYSTAIF